MSLEILKYQVLERTLATAENIKKKLITVHSRPLFAYQIRKGPLRNIPLTAIILQGPILKKNNFTIESAEICRKIFPEAIVIISTWDTMENREHLKRCRELGIEMVLSTPPAEGGPFNINFQIVSTRNGLFRARELKASYAVKMRSDERILNPDSLEFLIRLVQTFPLLSGKKQEARIVGASLGTALNKPYHLSDLFQFGTIEDMGLFWSLDLVSRETPITLEHPPERYLFETFLEQTGWQLKKTLDDSREAMAERCIIADKTALDLYWHKYARHREYRKLDYSRTPHEMSFAFWFTLYASRTTSKQGKLAGFDSVDL